MNAVSNLLLNLSLIPRVFARILNPGDVLKDYLGWKSAPYEIALRNGPKISVRPGTTDKGIVKEIFLLDHYRFALEHLPPGGTVVDVGAQIGVFTGFIAHHSPDAVVHSFEPMSDNYAMLEQNIAGNHFRNVHPHQQAVSSEEGELKLYLSDDNTGMHSLYRPSEKYETVQSVAFNTLYQKIGIDHCDVLKLDCEGAEYDIIGGASPEVLEKTKAIVMEYHNPEKNPAMLERLKAAGFEVIQSASQALIFAFRTS